MAMFTRQIGRKTIYFSDHALDRWWERCEANDLHGRVLSRRLLHQALKGRERLERQLPTWANVTRYHRARAEGFLPIDENSGFVINRNANGNYVAVTYIEKISVPA